MNSKKTLEVLMTKITQINLSSKDLELMLKTNFMEALKESGLRSFSFSGSVKVVLATVEGDPAAVLLFREIETAKLAEVDFIATSVKYRRKGASAALMKDLSAGYEEIWLELSSDNGPALAFYKKHGFKLQGRRANYYGKGVDALNMTKTKEA